MSVVKYICKDKEDTLKKLKELEGHGYKLGVNMDTGWYNGLRIQDDKIINGNATPYWEDAEKTWDDVLDKLGIAPKTWKVNIKSEEKGRVIKALASKAGIHGVFPPQLALVGMFTFNNRIDWLLEENSGWDGVKHYTLFTFEQAVRFLLREVKKKEEKENLAKYIVDPTNNLWSFNKLGNVRIQVINGVNLDLSLENLEKLYNKAKAAKS